MQSTRKSALLSSAKKAKLKSNPSRVRFAEGVVVNGSPLFPVSQYLCFCYITSSEFLLPVNCYLYPSLFLTLYSEDFVFPLSHHFVPLFSKVYLSSSLLEDSNLLFLLSICHCSLFSRNHTMLTFLLSVIKYIFFLYLSFS